jgi:hypothetical protein
MIDGSIEKMLARVPTEDRLLLISQCLRPSKTCKGKLMEEGIECEQDCIEPCVIRKFRETALNLGYQCICIAAGGSMALNVVKKYKPKGIVAIACSKELEEGIEGVKKMFEDNTPAIVLIPLTKVGCVDTEVDVGHAMEIINLPFSSHFKNNSKAVKSS